ncbi:uncharacterized protein LOC141710950 [Apium graveolens]|uniref:uncharacterized protein LOC141710950 n=1 Tax=Apium graveolens TaxID=4045 RepID=UPI003D7AB8A4
MARVLRDLMKKVEGDMEVGAAATAFTKKLESTPRESGLKHFNFDSFDGARDKHCGYHEDHGHATENCFSLKMFIEDQIKKGNMNQYLQRRMNDKDMTPGTAKNVVNVVFGGTASPSRSPNLDNEVMMIQPFEDEPIYFSYSDYEGLNPDHNLALVVTLDVANNEVKRILVDNGSSANIVFEHTLNRMELGHLRMDHCLEDPLYGFENTMIPIWGVIYLPIIFGTAPQQVSHVMKFYMISATSSYNMILGRPAITKLRAIPSTIHLKLKFSTPGGIGELKGDREMAGRCYGQALVMAETEPENRKKIMSPPKGQSIKKHREHLSKRAILDVNMIEDSGYSVTNADARI